MHGVSRRNGAARGEGADAPLKAPGVSAPDLDVGDVDAQRVRHHLSEYGAVSLALAGDAGGGHDLARDQDLHVRSLVGSDAGALDVGAEAHADVVAWRSGPQQTKALLQQPGVVPAVVDG